MEPTQSEFLAELEAGLVEATGKRASVPAAVAPRRRRRAATYLFAAAVALVSPLLAVNPSPAAASTCYTPDFVGQTHTKTCSNPMSWAVHNYQRAVWVNAKTLCYYFYSTANNVCGSGTVYPIGTTTACKTY